MSLRALANALANALALVVVVAGGVGVAGCRRTSGTTESSWHEPEPAPPIEGLAVRRAAPFHLSDERGKVVLLSFGYTSCLEICPATFAKVKNTLRDLGASAADVQFLYVSVDPERDRPLPFAAFLASVDPRFEGLFVEGDRLTTLLSDYHITVRKRLPDPAGYARRQVDPAAFYSMDHTSGFWGIDREGMLRFHLGHDATDRDLLAATRRLLGGDAARVEKPAIHVTGAVAHVVPSGVGAAYFSIVNDGSVADRLESVDSPAVTDAQLHDVVVDGDTTSMRALPDGIEVPAHSTVLLQQQGKHVMLFGLHDATAMQVVPLTLHFVRAGAVALEAPVRPMFE